MWWNTTDRNLFPVEGQRADVGSSAVCLNQSDEWMDGWMCASVSPLLHWRALMATLTLHIMLFEIICQVQAFFWCVWRHKNTLNSNIYFNSMCVEEWDVHTSFCTVKLKYLSQATIRKHIFERSRKWKVELLMVQWCTLIYDLEIT